MSEHVAEEDSAFARNIVKLFEHLNARLIQDIGPQGQVGHSYFMVNDLDDVRLRLIWEHHVWPLLDGHFAAQPRLRERYRLDDLLDGHMSRSGGRRAAAVPG